jgi:hypothetical protein
VRGDAGTIKLPVRSLNSLLESNFSSGAVSGAAVAALARPAKQNLMFWTTAADAFAPARQSVWMKSNLVF